MNKWLVRAKENWIYILAVVLIILFVWIYNEQKNVLVEGNNEGNQAQSNELEQKENKEEAKEESVENKETNKVSTSTVKQKIVIEDDQPKAEEVVREKVTVQLIGFGEYSIEINEGDNAFDITKKAASQNGLAFGYKNYPKWGRFVETIGNKTSDNTNFWALYYNGQSSAVGADAVKVKDGDVIKWQYEEFSG